MARADKSHFVVVFQFDIIYQGETLGTSFTFHRYKDLHLIVNFSRTFIYYVSFYHMLLGFEVILLIIQFL